MLANGWLRESRRVLRLPVGTADAPGPGVVPGPRGKGLLPNAYV